MNESPKKIWVDVPEAFIKPIMEDDISYIRSDLFYEMRIALKDMCSEFRMLDLPYGSKSYAKAITVLNKVWNVEDE
jgi:hypothetical protein